MLVKWLTSLLYNNILVCTVSFIPLCPEAISYGCPYISQALAKTLTANQLFYLKEQFELLGPNKSGYISLQNLKSVSNITFVI